MSCSYLCFESSSSRSASSKKNKVIKLQDITDIQKVCTMCNAFYYFVIFVLISGKLFQIYSHIWPVFILCQYKVLSVLPGSGMGISIATPSTQKVRSKLFALGYNLDVYTRLVPIIPFSMCVHVYFCPLWSFSLWCLAPWFTETKPLRPSSASTQRSSVPLPMSQWQTQKRRTRGRVLLELQFYKETSAKEQLLPLLCSSLKRYRDTEKEKFKNKKSMSSQVPVLRF